MNHAAIFSKIANFDRRISFMATKKKAAPKKKAAAKKKK